jgi:hypothetical protein
MIFCDDFVPQIIFSQLEVAGLETEAGRVLPDFRTIT